MTTQLLFGDLIEELDRLRGWSLVNSMYDDYEGWIDSRQLKITGESLFRKLADGPLRVNRSFPFKVSLDGKEFYLPAGCNFYPTDGHYYNGDSLLEFEGELHHFQFEGVGKLLESAVTYLHCPYLWGGKTFLGMDCSGFTQIIFKQHGIKLLRDAAQQATQGENIGFISDSRPGDLAFFDHNDGKISHVGLLIDEHSIIHCSGSVRIDPVDHQGIFDPVKKAYSHQLRLIRRILPQ